MSPRRTTRKLPPDQNRNAANDDDPVPDDIDQFRYELARRIATYVQAWRKCRRPACKRGKRCAGRKGCAGLATLRAPPAHKHPDPGPRLSPSSAQDRRRAGAAGRSMRREADQ